jgi:hypothetical protein
MSKFISFQVATVNKRNVIIFDEIWRSPEAIEPWILDDFEPGLRIGCTQKFSQLRKTETNRVETSADQEFFTNVPNNSEK